MQIGCSVSTKATIAAIEQPKTENTKTAKETKHNKTIQNSANKSELLSIGYLKLCVYRL